jgi:hypothetical protein
LRRIFYIPTRYPNGLPDLTPSEAYMEEDAEECIRHATESLAVVKSLLPDDGKGGSTHENSTDDRPVEGMGEDG